MPGSRPFRAALSMLLLAAGALVYHDVRRLAAGELPALSVEERLKIREAQVEALESSRELADFMTRIQAQLDAMPEYRKLKQAAQSAAENYTQALRNAVVVS